MGTRQETPEAFAGEVGRAVYDPEKNPFWRQEKHQEKRQEKKEPPPAPKANSSGFPGSFDDIMPNTPSEDDLSIEEAAEEAAEEVGDEELE
jgi:hypothetical protein